MFAQLAESADSSLAIRTKDAAPQRKVQKQTQQTLPQKSKGHLVPKKADIANTSASATDPLPTEKRQRSERQKKKKPAISEGAAEEAGKARKEQREQEEQEEQEQQKGQKEKEGQGEQKTQKEQKAQKAQKVQKAQKAQKTKKKKNEKNEMIEDAIGTSTNEIAGGSKSTPTWKLSPFLGGRYLRLDPVFSKDEKYLLVAQAASLKVYSTTTSLLVRAIDIPTCSSNVRNSDRIVSYCLDPRSDNRVYVTTSYSNIYLFDFTAGRKIRNWNLGLSAVKHACVCLEQAVGSSESEVVYTASGDSKIKRHRMSEDSVGDGQKLYQCNASVAALRVADAGRAVCLIAGRNVVVLNSENWKEPRVYPMDFPLTCMDIYLPDTSPETTKKKKGAALRHGDIVVGNNEGAIYVLHDVIKPCKAQTDPRPMKMHWHRMAVSSAKWALDGTYVVSGGRETVLAIWQRETGHRQYLPHLGAAINSVVVSPQGSSYAVALTDNSIMILSTSELKPKANIAGIQSAAVFRRHERGVRAVPCLLNPAISNNLLVATPSDQLDPSASSPYLQTFDTYSDRHISRQALTRTNATVTNHTPDNVPIPEPNVVLLAITKDGKWLASVDEWQPLKRNYLGEDPLLGLDSGKRQEIFLRFWNWDEAKKEWQLTTRIDAPHPSPEGMGSESVLDLTAAPGGHGFATVGSDGSVKIWGSKVRARPGATATTVSWGTRKVVNFLKARQDLDRLSLATLGDTGQITPSRQWWGNVAFSEDSSLLAVSCPDQGFSATEDSTLHFIDTYAGTIHKSLGGLNLGRTSGLAIIERYLVVVGTKKLLVWNLVLSRVEWEYAISELTQSTAPILHLAVDHKSRSLAVSLASPIHKKNCGKIYVWSPVSDPGPVFTDSLDVPVAALKSAGEGKGFLVLDRWARVLYVTELLAAHSSVASMMESGPELEENEGVKMLSGLYSVDKSGGEVEAMDMDADDGVEKVVAREALEGVFDEVEVSGPGSIVAAFDRVMALFAKAPLGDESEEEEEDGGEEGEEEDSDSD